MATGWYANPDPMFQPAMRFIIGITNDFPAVVTTSLDADTPGAHDYLDGMVVRLNVPDDFGMFEVNQKKGVITIIDSTSFAIDIDTRLLSAFVIPDEPEVFANVNPIAEINDTLRAATRNVLPSGIF